MMPFPGGIEALSNGTLFLSAAAAFIYLYAVRHPASIRRTIVKAGSVALLALLAFLENGPVLLVLALALGAAGDAFLAQENDKYFLPGVGSFLAAHLVMIVLFLSGGPGFDVFFVQPVRLLPALAVIALGVILARLLLPRLEASLRMPVMTYVLVIVAMGTAALTLPLPLVILGALLFVMSDAVLAVDKFLLAPSATLRNWTAPAVWIFYYLAQLCFTLGYLL